MLCAPRVSHWAYVIFDICERYNQLKSQIKNVAFAEDTVLYYNGNDLENVSRRVQEDFDILS